MPKINGHRPYNLRVNILDMLTVEFVQKLIISQLRRNEAGAFRCQNFGSSLCHKCLCYTRLYWRSIASILPTRFLCRSSEMSVEMNVSTISLISANEFWPLPSVRTFAPLCSREFRARAGE